MIDGIINILTNPYFLLFISLGFYLSIIHLYTLYKNSIGENRKEKIGEIIINEGNFRNITGDYANPVYEYMLADCVEFWVKSMGLDGQIEHDIKDGGHKFNFADDISKSIFNKLRFIEAKIFAGFSFLFFPFINYEDKTPSPLYPLSISGAGLVIISYIYFHQAVSTIINYLLNPSQRYLFGSVLILTITPLIIYYVEGNDE